MTDEHNGLVRLESLTGKQYQLPAQLLEPYLVPESDVQEPVGDSLPPPLKPRPVEPELPPQRRVRPLPPGLRPRESYRPQHGGDAAVVIDVYVGWPAADRWS